MKQLMKLKAAIVAVVCAAAFAVDALAATWHVDASSGSDANEDRYSWEAQKTIQAAIDAGSARIVE